VALWLLLGTGQNPDDSLHFYLHTLAIASVDLVCLNTNFDRARLSSHLINDRAWKCPIVNATFQR
jgi:hypothetical protein